jgi:hypothetical protein
MATYKERTIYLAVLSIGVCALFVASFANAQPNIRTLTPAQGVQSTQEVQNITANNYTGLEEKNKALVLKAFDTLFNQRDYVAAERYWSPNYIQHSAHIGPGREGLFNLVKSSPYIKDGVMVEHWDVIQDEASQEQSKSGLPMFGDKFPNNSSRTN